MKKTVFFFEDKNESDTNHPWIVISDPDADNNVVIVNATHTRDTGREDLSCILKGGCHPNIPDDSYIAYKFAKEISIYKINLLESTKRLTKKSTPLSDSDLKKIQEGAKKSKLLPKGLKKYFPES